MNNAAVFGVGIGNSNGLLRCGVVGPENNRTPVGRLPAAFGINHCSVKYDFVRAAALIFSQESTVAPHSVIMGVE